MERNILTIIDMILNQVPADDKVFIAELRDIKDSVPYTAPEAMLMRWERLTACINDFVGPPPLVEDWKIEAVATLMDKSFNTIKQLYGVKG